METRICTINPNYSVREDGHITNINTGRILKQSQQVVKGKITGYMYVTLIEKGDSYTFKRVAVHRLVGLAFLDNPNNKPWINHKDMVRGNNHYSNLEWSTISENIQHAFNNGRKMPSGKDHWFHGKKFSSETRNKMSQKKKGENHPKFKGVYVISGSRFESANQAGKALNIAPETIINRCNNHRFKDYIFIPK